MRNTGMHDNALNPSGNRPSGLEKRLNGPVNPNDAERSDIKNVIVVLGGSNQYKRLEKGLEICNKEPGSALILSGFGGFKLDGSGYDNVDLDRILYESDSKNTEENAMNSLKYMNRLSAVPDKVTVVSDYAHEPRSRYLFNKYNEKEFGSIYDIDFSGIKTEDKLHRVLYEMVAFPLSFLPYKMHEKITKTVRKYKTRNLKSRQRTAEGRV